MRPDLRDFCLSDEIWIGLWLTSTVALTGDLNEHEVVTVFVYLRDCGPVVLLFFSSFGHCCRAYEIKFSNGISITGVADGDWFKENFPKISIADKGKAPYVEPDTIKGHLAPVLKSLNGIAANEEQVLTWGETDSVQVALQRRLYIVAKYRELLLRKFLEAHRANFNFGQPWSAMALQIIELLFTAHSTDVKDLLTQKQAIQLEWTRPCCATLFEGAHIDRGFYIPRNHKTIFLSCWVRNLRFIEGSWLKEDGYDRWVSGCADPVSQLWEQLPQRISLDTLAPISFFYEPVQYPHNSTSPTVKTWGWYTISLNSLLSYELLFPSCPSSSIGNLQNHLLSRIDDLEKASVNARTQQDQDLRGLFKSVRQEVQIQKTALSFEVHEFKKGVKAQSGIFTMDLADIRKEVRDLSKEFDDKLAAIRNDLLEFHVETQEQYATLRAKFSELIAFVTGGRDDKKGEVGSSHGRGQPPSEERSKPGSGDGGSSGSRSEPS
ncbi:hypothetical protein F511_26752 [Dorcoceras hygrometricum]|uniref:Uncharacterized protein n=1 Tax=Dorcoceras hygrometricum TaxID=472368 RepID=A0A2Z7BZT0_9LAMI|nr:hypothetical protein F511_26752 [Dorcoceras hygrometricum]